MRIEVRSDRAGNLAGLHSSELAAKQRRTISALANDASLCMLSRGEEDRGVQGTRMSVNAKRVKKSPGIGVALTHLE